MSLDWLGFADVFARLRSPLRPTAGDVASVRTAIAGCDQTVLLVGVTPELAGLGQDLTAVDASLRMLRLVWPGDKPGRRAIIADWLRLPFSSGSITAVVGHGSLNAVADALPALPDEIARVLAPEGIAAFRTFCSPDAPETIAQIRLDVTEGLASNCHALNGASPCRLRRRWDGRFP